MGGRMLRGLTILILLAGHEIETSENELSSDKSQPQSTSQALSSNQQSKESRKQQWKIVLQSAESWWYSIFCSVWGIFPTWMGSLPLKLSLLKRQMVTFGPSPSCLNLILNAEFMLPSSNDIRRLKESKLPVVWVVGGPGSGKGTICKMMVSAEGYTHISVGDLLREDVSKDPDSFINRLIDSIMKQGNLLPSFVSLTILTRKMLSELDSSKGFLIDGFPRSLSGAMLFQNKIKPPDTIIYLKASDEIMKSRVLKRNKGRSDDNEETVRKRLEVFHKQQDFVTSNKMFADKVKEVITEGIDVNASFQKFSKAIHESMKTTDISR